MTRFAGSIVATILPGAKLAVTLVDYSSRCRMDVDIPVSAGIDPDTPEPAVSRADQMRNCAEGAWPMACLSKELGADGPAPVDREHMVLLRVNSFDGTPTRRAEACIGLGRV